MELIAFHVFLAIVQNELADLRLNPKPVVFRFAKQSLDLDCPDNRSEWEHAKEHLQEV